MKITPPWAQEKRKLPANVETMLTARKDFKAYIPFILVMILLMGSAALQVSIPANDVLRYQCYATVFWLGHDVSHLLNPTQCQFLQSFSQFHTVPLEYPPLMMVFFSLPLLAPMINYPLMFALCMLAVAFGIYWLLLRHGPRYSAGLFTVFLLIGAGSTAFTRFDLIPAGFTLLCLILAEQKRWRLAYIALALGGLTKIYPVMFFPILFLAEQAGDSPKPVSFRNGWREVWHFLARFRRWHWKNSQIFIGLTLGMTVFWGLFNLEGATLNSLDYFFRRPFQAESLGSTFLWLTSLMGIPVTWIISFGSLNSVSPIADGVAQVLVVLLIVTYAVILVQQLCGKMNLSQAVLAALFVVVATGKIFSPQYLIWFIPLLVYNGASKRIWLLLWGGLSFLTFLIYPVFYSQAMDALQLPPTFGFLQTIAIRNILFLVISIAYLMNFFNLRNPTSCSGNAHS